MRENYSKHLQTHSVGNGATATEENTQSFGTLRLLSLSNAVFDFFPARRRRLLNAKLCRFSTFPFPIHLLLPSPVLCPFRGIHGSGVMTLSHATQPPELRFFSGYVKPHPQTARDRARPQL